MKTWQGMTHSGGRFTIKAESVVIDEGVAHFTVERGRTVALIPVAELVMVQEIEGVSA